MVRIMLGMIMEAHQVDAFHLQQRFRRIFVSGSSHKYNDKHYLGCTFRFVVLQFWCDKWGLRHGHNCIGIGEYQIIFTPEIVHSYDKVCP
jgi:hypothetical protein